MRSVILATALLLLIPASAAAQYWPQYGHRDRDWRSYDRWRCATDGQWCYLHCYWNQERIFVCRHDDDDDRRYRERGYDHDDRDHDRDHDRDGYHRPY